MIVADDQVFIQVLKVSRHNQFCFFSGLLLFVGVWSDVTQRDRGCKGFGWHCFVLVAIVVFFRVGLLSSVCHFKGEVQRLELIVDMVSCLSCCNLLCSAAWSRLVC